MTSRAPFKRAALVVNTRARQGRQQADHARRLLTAAGVSIAKTYALRSSSRLSAAVGAALDAGCDLIILGGGDGTVSAVVDLLARRHAVLGLLPLGTANDFARTLGIPDDLEGACATIARGKIVDVDLGRADDIYYVNVASIGLGARVITRISPRLKRIAGTVAYPVAAVRALVGFHPFAATLTFPQGDHPPATFPRLVQIGVGNGRFYGGGWRSGAGASSGCPTSTTTRRRPYASRRSAPWRRTWTGSWSIRHPCSSPRRATRSGSSCPRARRQRIRPWGRMRR